MEIPLGVALGLDDRRLHLILLPTEKCNLRCTYCYEDFKIGKMAPEVITGVKNLITKRADDIDYLEISWFGGEPLLAFDVIQDISSHIKSRRAKSGFSYFANVTTNAYLLNRSRFLALLDLGVTNYQVSLDGTKPFHDKTRKLAGGGGTFDQIFANLNSIKSVEGDFKVVIRVHVMRQNAGDATNAIQQLSEVFRNDKRFYIYPKSIEHLGGPNDEDIELMSRAEFEKLISAVGSSINRYELPHDGTHQYICYAAKANSLIVRANGNIGKCTVALYDDKNILGTLSCDGNLDIDSEKYRMWIGGLFSQDVLALSCPLAAMNVSKLATVLPGAGRNS